MGKLIDLTGQIYGSWTVIAKAQKPAGSKSSSAFWLCQCKCGTEKIMSGNVLKQGKSKSCGCETKQLKLESSSEDLTNKRFGNLIVIKRVPRSDNLLSDGSYWLCQRNCGNQKIIMGKSLRKGKTTTCGCHMQQYANLIGQRFGKLTVIGRESRTGKWTCQCDCGNITYATGINLRHKNVQSCGCISSIGEYNIEQVIKENNIPYIKQFSFSDLRGPKNGLLRFDFAIMNDDGSLNRLIEFQGQQHYPTQQSKFFDPVILITDNMKKEYCFNHNIKLVCIPYWKRDTLTIKDIMSDDNGSLTFRARQEEA